MVAALNWDKINNPFDDCSGTVFIDLNMQVSVYMSLQPLDHLTSPPDKLTLAVE